jgi:hypothetical protein
LEAFAKIAQLRQCRPVFVTSRVGGTGWGGYVLREVDDPKAFDLYQLFCNQNYWHVVYLTFEPLFDFDAALAETGRAAPAGAGGCFPYDNSSAAMSRAG